MLQVSEGSILQYFLPQLIISYHLSLRPLSIFLRPFYTGFTVISNKTLEPTHFLKYLIKHECLFAFNSYNAFLFLRVYFNFTKKCSCMFGSFENFLGRTSNKRIVTCPTQ